MGEINLHNYELFMIDFLEGQLETDVHQEMIDFLNQHPEIRSEIEELDIIQVSADESSTFSLKESLKKVVIIPYEAITENNYEEIFIENAEGSLDKIQQESLAKFIEINPDLEQDFRIYSNLKLESDPTIKYEHKAQLKKRAAIWKPMYSYGVAVAASIVILLSIGMFLNSEEPDITPDIPVIALENIEQIQALYSFETIDHKIKSGSINQIVSEPIMINFAEISRFTDEGIVSLHSNVKSLQNFAFNYKVNIQQYYILDKVEFFDPAYLELVARNEYENQNKLKVGQALWKGIFGSLGVQKKPDESPGDTNSDNGVVFWALTSIGVDHINNLTGSDLKLHRKVNEEGEFDGYAISKKDYNTVISTEDKPE